MMKIGCDPEFLPITDFKALKIEKDPYKVAAKGGWRNHLERQLDELDDYECDENTPMGNIGDDGGNNVSIGELRPKPGTPKEVTQNIKKMFKFLAKKKYVVDIIAGGGGNYDESLGGHIHFGMQLGCTVGHCERPERLATNEKSFIKALDHYIGKPLKKKKGGNRVGSCYGSLSDIKIKEYRGGERGLEYRTPPSWLTSPELTEGVLWTAWAIATCYQKDHAFWSTFRPTGKRPKMAQFDALKAVCPARGKKMIDTYFKILNDRKFDLGQKCALSNWTGKKVTL